MPIEKPAVFALIPCAGVGARAGGNQPKQYQLLAGKSLLAHTLAAFEPLALALAHVLVVVSPQDTQAQALVTEGLSPRPEHAPAHAPRMSVAACGGDTRAQTVLAGLNVLIASHKARLHDWVLVHDAARCLVTPERITHLMAACANDDVGGLLAIPLADTLKRSRDGRSEETLERSDKWLAQTPQMFRIGMLRDALMACGDQVTDEASAIEMLGHSPKLVMGATSNLKITFPEDFLVAQALLDARKATA
jgi:2-C-methyl-D-erythritol 4-phosphate cytidylyltransferase